MGLIDIFALINPKQATVFWYLARGSGFVVFVLLTLAVCLGLLLSLKWRTDAWPRIITTEIHPFVILLAGSFLVLHIVSVLLDSFVRFQIYQAFIPFTSGYRPIWLSMGIVSMYIAIALVLSDYVRKFIGYRKWRMLHYLSFLAWTLALVHAVATGTDARAPWAIAVYAGATLLIIFLISIRLVGLPIPLGQPPRFRAPALAALTIALVVGIYGAAAGPWSPGWARRAQVSPLKPVSWKAVPSVYVSIRPSFKDRVSGTATIQHPAQAQPGSTVLNMRLHARGRQNFAIAYGLLLAQGETGQAQYVRGLFSAVGSKKNWSCAGAVTYQPPNQLTSTCQIAGKRPMEMVTKFSLSRAGAVSGQLSAIPASGKGGRPDGEGSNDHESGSSQTDT